MNGHDSKYLSQAGGGQLPVLVGRTSELTIRIRIRVVGARVSDTRLFGPTWAPPRPQRQQARRRHLICRKLLADINNLGARVGSWVICRVRRTTGVTRLGRLRPRKVGEPCRRERQRAYIEPRPYACCPSLR